MGRVLFVRHLPPRLPSIFAVHFNRICLECIRDTCTRLAFLLYPGHVGFRDGVPGGHVLLHAGREAGLLTLGEGCAGLRHAALEAVLIEFL